MLCSMIIGDKRRDPVKNSSALVATLVVAGFCSAPLRADINGFWGPWEPADAGGNLLNYEGVGSGLDDYSFFASISPDHSTLTLEFENFTGDYSIFSNYIDDSLLPSGTVSYDWSWQLLQSGNFLIETDVNTHDPGCDCTEPLSAGTYSGTATLNYTSGNYFSFGNMGFGGTPGTGILTLTNFQYIGDAVYTPEPSTIYFLAGGLLVLPLVFWLRRRRAA